jgi:AhpD family alkylhydroperoxidase
MSTLSRWGFLAVAVAAFAVVTGFSRSPAGSANAQDAPPSVEATLADIQSTMGSVPSFLRQLPPAILPGAWAELKALEFSPTALDAKTKALIGIAVAAQIPCEYCVWADTNTAKAAGATDEEIAEAVATAALSRHWSTIFHGLQVDLATFKAELGGDKAAK